MKVAAVALSVALLASCGGDSTSPKDDPSEKTCTQRDGDGDGVICEGLPNEQHA